MITMESEKIIILTSKTTHEKVTALREFANVMLDVANEYEVLDDKFKELVSLLHDAETESTRWKNKYEKLKKKADDLNREE